MSEARTRRARSEQNRAPKSRAHLSRARDGRTTSPHRSAAECGSTRAVPRARRARAPRRARLHARGSARAPRARAASRWVKHAKNQSGRIIASRRELGRDGLTRRARWRLREHRALALPSSAHRRRAHAAPIGHVIARREVRPGLKTHFSGDILQHERETLRVLGNAEKPRRSMKERAVSPPRATACRAKTASFPRGPHNATPTSCAGTLPPVSHPARLSHPARARGAGARGILTLVVFSSSKRRSPGSHSLDSFLCRRG